MNKTALYDKHVSLGAKIVPFAGFDMPVQYSGVTEEHFAVREKVGIFDVSHMGQFFVEGPSAKNLLERIMLIPSKMEKHNTRVYQTEMAEL